MMQTRCPGCATVFRITPEQLKARHGKVRCGKCQKVFDALAALVDAPSIAAAQTIVQEEESWPKTVPMDFSSDDDTPPNETAAVPETSAGEALAAPDETLVIPVAEPAPAPETQTEPAAPAAVATAAPATAPAPAAAPTPAQAPFAEVAPAPEPAVAPAKPSEPPLHDDYITTPRPRAWPWLLASLLALLVLALQLLIQFRVETAVLAPELKPTLHALCGMLDCDLPLPRKADQLSIETSDLHPDPNHKGLLILAATLKNRAPFVQTYPHLELTLTDTLDQPLLRKIVAPAEYLAKGSDVTTGFGANREIAVNLALIPESAGKAAPAGYRLYLFYP